MPHDEPRYAHCPRPKSQLVVSMTRFAQHSFSCQMADHSICVANDIANEIVTFHEHNMSCYWLVHLELLAFRASSREVCLTVFTCFFGQVQQCSVNFPNDFSLASWYKFNVVKPLLKAPEAFDTTKSSTQSMNYCIWYLNLCQCRFFEPGLPAPELLDPRKPTYASVQITN